MKIVKLTNKQQYTISDIYTFNTKDIEKELELESKAILLEIGFKSILLKIEQELYVYIALKEHHILKLEEQCSTSTYITIDDNLITFYHIGEDISFGFWYGFILHIPDIELAELLLSLI